MLFDFAQVEPVLVILADNVGVNMGDFAGAHDQSKDALVVELQGSVVTVWDEVGVMAVRHQTPLRGLQDDRGDAGRGAIPQLRVLVTGGDYAAHKAAGVFGVGEGLGDLLLEGLRADKLDGVLRGTAGVLMVGRVRR